MHDVIVIGSGAAGAWACDELVRQKLRVCAIDVGHTSSPQNYSHDGEGNYFTLRKTQSHDFFIGKDFDTLSHLFGNDGNPKLKAPRYKYVTAPVDDLPQLQLNGFQAVQSFAQGGLASAWGAGAYEFSHDDVSALSVSVAEIKPYYDELTRRIGISGTREDDLSFSFGSSKYLLPPPPLDHLGGEFLNGYKLQHAYFKGQGLSVGLPRLAVRKDFRQSSGHFWKPGLAAVYSPAETMKSLIDRGALEYFSKRVALRFSENADGVTVIAKNLDTQSEEAFKAKALILAAGALNSGRLVLQSFDDYETTLPILDNLVTMIPLIRLKSIGRTVDQSSHGFVQANLILRNSSGDYCQGSFYSFSTILTSEVALKFPLAARGCLWAAKHLMPAMAMVSLFYPDEQSGDNHLRLLEADKKLYIQYKKTPNTGAHEKKLIRLFRKMGFYSHISLVKLNQPGQGIHYAGTLPCTKKDSIKYRTDKSGKLLGSRSVYVADASVFERLPAKNLTLTIMANAMRVANQVSISL